MREAVGTNGNKGVEEVIVAELDSIKQQRRFRVWLN